MKGWYIVMNNRELILHELQEIRGKLITVLNLLDDENTEGKQFDYVNAPRLSDSFDAVNRTVKRIEKIIYQED
jgi:hypothetical protein